MIDICCRIAARGFCLLLLLSVVGCKESTGRVSGTVVYQGQKIPTGTVTFLVGGKIVEAEIQDGVYEVRNVPLGEAKITVVRIDPNQPDPYEAVNKTRKQLAQATDAAANTSMPSVLTDPVKLQELQKKRHTLPLFYSSPETSDLRFLVGAGANTFNIQLLDRPASQ